MLALRPVHAALAGKGPVRMMKRATVITRRYGLSQERMNETLAQLERVLWKFDARATLAITAAVLERSHGVVERCTAAGIELAVHGLHHIDYSDLPLEQQVSDLVRARQVFEERGLRGSGFRSPYLRSSATTLQALEHSGYEYDSSQAVAWEVVNTAQSEAYARVLEFCGAVSATRSLAVPRTVDGLLEIPYCLPDDEAVVDRLHLDRFGGMSEAWLSVLGRTHHLGELFTLGLHPERIESCEAALTQTLRVARRLSPAVWFARLDEINAWWRARSATQVRTIASSDGGFRVCVEGPEGVTLLARGVDVREQVTRWDNGYMQIAGPSAEVHCAQRPFVGISASSSPALAEFLGQQGYIVEKTSGAGAHSVFLDRPVFGSGDERALLAQLESPDLPLVRLGRWPNGAKSALCVTGDIDALTLWDYGLRLVGR